MADQVQALGPGDLRLEFARRPVERNRTVDRPQQSGHGAQQAGLARAISSRKRHGLSGPDLQIKAREQPSFTANKT